MYRAHLEKLSRTPLDDVLLDEGIVDRATLEAAQAEQEQSGRPIADILIESEIVEEWDVAKIVTAHYNLPFLDLGAYSIPGPVLELLPLDWCREQLVLPIDQFGKTLAVACVEVPRREIVEQMCQRTGCTPFVYIVARRALRDVIDETVKRRGGRTAPASSITGRAVARTRTAVSQVVEAAEEAPPSEELPPLDLPVVSFQLDASASRLGSAPAPRTSPQRAAGPRPAPPAVAGNGRPAPVVPGTAPSEAPAAAPAGRTASQSGRKGWESIFDSGDDAVKRTSRR